jgi:hypothetical protein
MKTKIIRIFTALVELEAKGCHTVFFEYGNGLFRVRIFKGEAINEKAVYQRVINPTRKPAGFRIVNCLFFRIFVR